MADMDGWRVKGIHVVNTLDDDDDDDDEIKILKTALSQLELNFFYSCEAKTMHSLFVFFFCFAFFRGS